MDRNTLSVEIAQVPPKDTHQSRLRIFRMKNGRQFIGRKAASMETKRLELALAGWIFRIKSIPAEKKLLERMQSGPIQLAIALYYPWPASASKADKAKTLPKTTRPDADNLVKTIQDALGSFGLFSDDSQITHLEISKYNSPEPRIRLVIGPL